MPSVNDLLKKHEPRVKGATKGKQRIERKGPTRPWQENLQEYAPNEESQPDALPGADASSDATSSVATKEAAQTHPKPSEPPFTAPEAVSKAALRSVPEEQSASGETTLPREVKAGVASRNKAEPKSTIADVLTPPASKVDTPPARSAPSAPAISCSAAKLIHLISNNGFDVSMKFVLLCELANADGLIQCSQQFLAAQLNVNLKSVKRLFDDLCERKLIELAKESDPATKAPREYRLLYRRISSGI
jgi:hypothetical protein